MENKLVALIESDKSSRKALSSFLITHGFNVVVFEFGDEMLQWITPDSQAVIVAEAVPTESVALLCALRDAGCRQPFIAMTANGTIQQAVEAIKAGAADYLEKPLDLELLLRKLDHCFLALAALAAKGALLAVVQARLHSLSRRETQVLGGLVKGLSNRATGLALGISPRTVEVYRANIMSKMAVASLPELVRVSILAEAVG